MQLDGITGDDIRGGICSIRKVGYLKQNQGFKEIFLMVKI